LNYAGWITTLYGLSGAFNNIQSGDNKAAATAFLTSPQSVVVTAVGDVLIADAGHFAIRKVGCIIITSLMQLKMITGQVSSMGIMSTIVGDGARIYSIDRGQATSTCINSPRGMALSSSGDLIYSDKMLGLLRKVKNRF